MCNIKPIAIVYSEAKRFFLERIYGCLQTINSWFWRPASTFCLYLCIGHWSCSWSEHLHYCGTYLPFVLFVHFVCLFVCLAIQTLPELIEKLRLEQLTGEPLIFRVRRSHVLADILELYSSDRFDPTRPMAIEFENEPGMDGGGLGREFFTLAVRSAVNTLGIFVTDSSPLHFHYSVTSWKDGVYETFGKLVAHSIISGGPGVPCFPRWLYTYISTGDMQTAVSECTRADLGTSADRALVEEVSLKCLPMNLYEMIFWHASELMNKLLGSFLSGDEITQKFFFIQDVLIISMFWHK